MNTNFDLDKQFSPYNFAFLSATKLIDALVVSSDNQSTQKKTYIEIQRKKTDQKWVFMKKSSNFVIFEPF